jgi:hypothetical protein
MQEVAVQVVTLKLQVLGVQVAAVLEPHILQQRDSMVFLQLPATHLPVAAAAVDRNLTEVLILVLTVPTVVVV